MLEFDRIKMTEEPGTDSTTAFPDRWLRNYDMLGLPCDSTNVGDRIVGQTQVGKYFVSTVNLNIELSHVTGHHMGLFETMIFEDGTGDFCWRYPFIIDAYQGHAHVCRVLAGETPDTIERPRMITEIFRELRETLVEVANEC